MPGQLLAQFVQLRIRQPALAVVGAVEIAHRFVKHPRQQPLAEVVTQARASLLRHTAALVDHCPALLGKLVEERLLNLGVFAHRARPSLRGRGSLGQSCQREAQRLVIEELVLARSRTRTAAPMAQAFTQGRHSGFDSRALTGMCW